MISVTTDSTNVSVKECKRYPFSTRFGVKIDSLIAKQCAYENLVYIRLLELHKNFATPTQICTVHSSTCHHNTSFKTTDVPPYKTLHAKIYDVSGARFEHSQF